MNLTVKLYATLTKYLPAEAEKQTTQIEITNTATPHNVIEQFHVPQESAHLVLINGVYVKPADRDRAIFSDGDTLAVWPPVAGG